MFVVRTDTTGLDINVDVEIDATDYERDNLASRLPALSSTPENYEPEDFEWSVRQTPEVSDGEL